DKISPRVRLEVVVAGLARLRLVGCDDRSAGIEHQSDVAFEPDRIAEILSSRKNDRAAAGCASRINGFVDRGCVQSLSVSACAVLAHIEGFGGGLSKPDRTSEP